MIKLTDLHLGSGYDSITFDRALEYARDKIPTVWLGDIFDFKNIKRKELDLWLQRAEYLKATAEDNGHLWIRGNHELNQLSGRDWAVVGDTFYAHGDLGFLWSKEKGTAYRAKKPGAGWFKRHVISPLINEAREIVDAKIKPEFLEAVAGLWAKHGVTQAYFGHSHPQKTITGYSGKVCFSVLSRGVHE